MDETMTQEQRNHLNKQRRKWWRDKSIHDPEWHAKLLSRREEWHAKKRARCPEYKLLQKLWKRKTRLRESLKLHLDAADKRDSELLDTVREIARLSKECKGK